MEDYGFLEASDPMYISTVLKIRDQLSINGMMFRYNNKDDFVIPRNSMIICTFWLINSLFKIGFKEEAIALFERMLKCSNHLGLFSEHIDISSFRLLGNFPHGYSHIGVIRSAMLLNGFEAKVEEEKLTFKKP